MSRDTNRAPKQKSLLAAVPNISHRSQSQDDEQTAVVPATRPELPSDLKTNIGARSSFSKFLRLIDIAGVPVSKADSESIGRMVKIHLRLIRNERIIATKTNNGYYDSVSKTTGVKIIRKHPCLNDIHTDEKELRQWFRRFGLDPRAREEMNLSTGGAAQDSDPFAGYNR